MMDGWWPIRHTVQREEKNFASNIIIIPNYWFVSSKAISVVSPGVFEVFFIYILGQESTSL